MIWLLRILFNRTWLRVSTESYYQIRLTYRHEWVLEKLGEEDTSISAYSAKHRFIGEPKRAGLLPLFQSLIEILCVNEDAFIELRMLDLIEPCFAYNLGADREIVADFYKRAECYRFRLLEGVARHQKVLELKGESA